MNKWESSTIDNSAETAMEQYRGRIEVAKRLVKELGADYVRSRSYADKFENIELADENGSNQKRIVRVVLGLPGYLQNGTKYPNEMLRIYQQKNSGSEQGVAWESLSAGDKYEILKAACPAGDISKILGE